MLILYRCFIFVTLLFSTQTLADVDATADVITVKSESMQLNRQTGIHTLSGNVVITHHNITILADVIQVTRINSAISRFYGKGSPLRFEQLLPNGELIRIESSEMDYQTRSWKILLSGNVNMQRGSSKIVASSVEYDLRNNNYSAKKSDASNARVEFTYIGQSQ